MAESARARPIVQAETLLTYYGFDLSGYTVNRTIQNWLRDYRADWIPAAIVEALYQGRYKAVSVRQILSLWKRLGQPLRHFNHEFETILCRELPYPPELTSLLLPSSRTASGSSSSPSLDNVVELPTKSQAVWHPEEREEPPSTARVSTDSAMRPSLSMSETSSIPPSNNGNDTNDTEGSTNGSAANGLESVNPDGAGTDDLAEFAQSVKQPRDTQECDLTQSHSSTPVEAEQTHEATSSTTADQQAPEAIPPFQPTPLNRRAELRVLQVSNSSKHSSKPGVTPPDSIHQFIPEVSLSNTHAKLKAVAQPESRSEEH